MICTCFLLKTKKSTEFVTSMGDLESFENIFAEVSNTKQAVERNKIMVNGAIGSYQK